MPGAGALGLVASFLETAPPIRRMALLGLAVLIAYPLFYGYRNIGLHPHYHYVTWWVIPLGIAGAVTWLRKRTALGAGILTSMVWCLAGLQFAFIMSWMTFIGQRGGTRGPHYMTTIGIQRRAIQTACTRPEAIVFIENETAQFDHSLQYIAGTDPACVGKRIVVCRSCPAPGAGVARVHLQYARPVGGEMVVQ